MIAANICAAKFTAKAKKAVYRIHDIPDFTSLNDLLKKLKAEGINQNVTSLRTPQGFADFLTKINSLENSFHLQKEALKASQKAIYSINNLGHFGLALDCYTHFTSPIRRYSDLVVHRLIKNLLADKQIYRYSGQQLTEVTDHCNLTEKRANEAVWESEKIYKYKYMLNHIGEIFEAYVIHTTENKIFFELKTIPIYSEVKNPYSIDNNLKENYC